MKPISFESKITKVGNFLIIKLPKSESSKLPSRGMVMVKGTINGFPFQSPLEPDGKGSHWLKIENEMLNKSKLDIGDSVTLEIEPTKDWPEPEIPDDLQKALNDSPTAHKTWIEITPMARWDWIRWINSTKNPETRKIRIEKTFSKFKSGIRRPCCFNRTMCTFPEISHNGVLLDSN